MKWSPTLVVLSTGAPLLLLLLLSTMTVVGAQEHSADDGFERQSDFHFPGPRRQQQQQQQPVPVFGGGGGRSRHRPSSSFQPVVDSVESAVVDDGSFQEELPPPPPAPSRSYRPSSSDLPRFASRPQSSSSSDDSLSGGKLGDQALAEEEQKQEPDRLELLLKDSKFSCSQKKQGYYADDGLSCEVFHYCNDGVRHSWMCPAGTIFHQIHLICMQEGGDNICQQSSKYYIVNDYLYKPLTQSTRDSNGTVRYADRYYPSEQGDVSSAAVVEEDDFRRPAQQYFDLPPPPARSSSSARFRPVAEEDSSAQFRPRPASNEDFGGGSSSSFGAEDDAGVQFLPPQNRFRGGARQRAPQQHFPQFERS